MELRKKGGVRDELDRFREMQREVDDRKRLRLEELGLPPRTDERGLQERPRQEAAQREELMRLAGPTRPAELEPEEPFPEEEEQTEEATAQDAALRAVELNVGQFLEFSDPQLEEIFGKGTLRGKRVVVTGLDARRLAGVLLQQRGRMPVVRDRDDALEAAREAVQNLRWFEDLQTPIRRSVNAGSRAVLDARGDLERRDLEAARQELATATRKLDDAAEKTKAAALHVDVAARLSETSRELVNQEAEEGEAITAEDAGPVREVAWSSESIRTWLRECDAAGGRATFRTRVLGLQLAPGQLLAICRVGRRRAAGVDSVRFTEVPGELVDRLRSRPPPVLTRSIVESYLES